MILKTKLFGHVYEFKSIREVMAKANEEKSGDKLAGIAAETAEERVAAKVVLSNLYSFCRADDHYLRLCL